MLFNIWTRSKDGQMLAELPKAFAGKRFFIALTISSGDTYAGLQSGEMVVEFRQYDERLAIIQPNLDVTAKGEAEAAASVKRLFTDRVLMDIPIIAKGPSGGPGYRYGLPIGCELVQVLWKPSSCLQLSDL